LGGGVHNCVDVGALFVLIKHVLQVLHALDECVHTPLGATTTVLFGPLAVLLKVALQRYVQSLQVCVLDLKLVSL